MKLAYPLLAGMVRSVKNPVALLGIALFLGTSSSASAAILNNVLATKHNLSASGPGPVKAVSETQVCVFCHTPHGGDSTAGAPLWNRPTSTATYTPYFSLSMNAAQPPGAPGSSSKLCLSCHDGTMAIGLVINLNGKGSSIAMQGTGPGGVMPDGTTLPNTGYTSNLGTSMTNDHPISFTYDPVLAANNGEMRTPPVMNGTETVVGNRAPGVKPTFPLESSQMQCASCHDPHFWDSDPNDPPLKFLRGMRLQLAAPLGGIYVESSDIMCLACHYKDNGTYAWSYSAHANVNVATESYTDASAGLLEFPLNTTVWQASCLGCHDTHTVPGAQHLLRDATDSTLIPKSGGNSAMEQTCYMCHSAQTGNNFLNPNAPPNTVPDIQTDVESAFHMPIEAQPETHNVGGSFDDSTGGGLATGTSGQCNASGDQCSKDLMESEALLGKVSAGGLATNRHTECTDCHNPHRATKNRILVTNAVTPDAAGTHLHNIDSTNPAPHNNIASGSLRGTFGVEPVYSSNDFNTYGNPTAFTVKRGDPGSNTLTDTGETYVTREYQVCFKCHSNYGYDDPPLLGYAGGTPQSTNGYNTYLNTAMEFQAPTTHQGAPAATTDSGASSTYSANNYRSWHPVMNSTGRTVTNRGNASPNLWRSPWNGSTSDGPTATTLVTTATTFGAGAVGNQTMYCSDCHGSVNSILNGVVPDGNGTFGAWTEDGKPWGPHGSTDYFILKGSSDPAAPVTAASDTLCFRCHDATQYADATGAPAAVLQSGFSLTGTDILGQTMTNLHQRHAYYTSAAGLAVLGANTVWPSVAAGTYRCTMCHTGAAHGWKNKDFLVNLNDLGPELDKNTNSTMGGALGGETAPGPVTLTTGQGVVAGTSVPATMATVPSGYTNGPYYQGALLYVNSFAASGQWTKASCANSGCH
jgi:hypothetical protein